MIQGTKVVTCDEMRRLEKLSSADGVTTEEMMDRAGKSLFAVVTDWFELSNAPKDVVLLIGKGNKGGDALTLGVHLMQNHYHVTAIPIYPNNELAPLCKKRLDQFIAAGGSVEPFTMEKSSHASLIVDGIVGTGFHGTPDDSMSHAITWANEQDAALLAIDLPSGLDGTTGVVESVAISATITCCLGLPKIGCFIGQGWDRSGAILTCDIQLPPEIVYHTHTTALLLKKESLELPAIVRSRHKYEAGYILGIAGSPEMPGAAALTSLATLRSGAGIVRLFSPEGTSQAHLPPEVIRETINLKKIEQEQERADALFIGPGLGRSSDIQKNIKKLLPLLKKPTVVDGDGLFHLAEIRNFSLPTGSILTPHHGEMKRLLAASPTLENCQKWVDEHDVTVILKGAPTILFHPKRHPLIVTNGDPGMATAGTGDVLTGIVTALLAQKMPPDTAAPLAVYLHGRAGELAAEHLTSYSMIASDLIHYLPKAFAELI